MSFNAWIRQKHTMCCWEAYVEPLPTCSFSSLSFPFPSAFTEPFLWITMNYSVYPHWPRHSFLSVRGILDGFWLLMIWHSTLHLEDMAAFVSIKCWSVYQRVCSNMHSIWKWEAQVSVYISWFILSWDNRFNFYLHLITSMSPLYTILEAE